jgi:hypothetical protein
MGLFDDFFGGGKNPADAAMPYYNQIPGMEKQYYNPYIDRGNSAYNKFNPIIDRMSSDPTGFLKELMGNYTQSKDFQLKNDQLTRAAGNTAAAGGMRGSLDDINSQAHITDSLMGDDMQRWLGNVLGIQQHGLEGEEGLYNTGFDATKSLTGDLSNVLGTQGSLAFQGQANRNQSHNDLLSGLMKMFGTVGGFELPTGGEGGSIFGRFANKFF